MSSPRMFSWSSVLNAFCCKSRTESPDVTPELPKEDLRPRPDGVVVFPAFRTTFGAEDDDVVVVWVRTLVNTAITEEWPQDQLVNNTLDLLYDIAYVKAHDHVLANPQFVGLFAFVRLLRFLIGTFGGPDSDILDAQGRYYALRESSDMHPEVVAQKMQDTYQHPHSSRQLIRELGPEVHQSKNCILSFDDYHAEMINLVRRLKAAPFLRRYHY